ncbi:MAG: HYR domain-containing protein, partial [Bacteroidota bacterium]
SSLGRYKTKVNQINNGSFDNCGITSLTVDIPIFDCSNLGSNNQVVFTVTDHSGNQSICTANVTIIDQVTPKIRCPLPITVLADPVTCTASVNYLVRFIDNCPGAVLNQLEGLPSGSDFPVGTTVNDFEVVDAQGLSKTCSFTVTVLDPGGCTPQLPSTVTPLLFSEKSIEALEIFPNPNRGDLRISWIQNWEGKTRLQLIDLNGQVVAERSGGNLLAGSQSLQWQINRTRLTSGTYTLLLSGPQGQRAIQRIVIID